MSFHKSKSLLRVPGPVALGLVTALAGFAAVSPLVAQTVTATVAPQGPISLRGSVLDPDGAEIPGATVTLSAPGGKALTTTSGSDGTYALSNVPAGTYSLTVTMANFATFVRQGVRITPGTPVSLDAKLAIQNAEQTINVTTAQNAVSVDQDSNASSTVLKGKDLDALSDDPDELSSELSALAGPAAGPNGGQIYIDGFTGGQLPPKSSIREIRINQNPFSAQYDRVGFGRVEVFTKPGTDKFHGQIQVNGSDRSFNTGSPFVPAGTQQPDYHTIFTFGSVTGPINKRASFTLNGSDRAIQDNAVVNPPSIFATSQTSGTVCLPGTAGCNIYTTNNNNGYAFVQFTPQTRWDISPRVDVALSEKNTLTTRFQYEHNSQQNGGIGGLDLQSTGFNTTGTELTLQVSDTQIISSKVINETRFEYQRPTDQITPFSTAPTLNVQGAFTGGGSNAGASSDTQTHFELQNYTSVALAKHFLRLGGRLRTTRETNSTTAGSNGTFTYNSICDYTGQTISSVCAPAGGAGISTPSQYTVTNITNPTITSNYVDLGLYAEDDWKIRPNLTFSYGLRFETQNFIHDHADFAPRLSVAYGLSKKTVLRAGAGIFYDRFNLSNILNVDRNNGINQQQYIIRATANAAIPAGCTPSNPAACPVTTAGGLTTRSISGNLRAPYSIQTNIGVDQQLLKGATVSVNYQNIRGIHQFNSAVANYTSLTANSPIRYQYQSEGIFNQNQIVTNINYRAGRATFFGFYVLNFAKSDTSGAGYFGSNPTRLNADYGRASFDVRSRLFFGGTFTLPFLINLSPFLVANSGSPYNIVTGIDTNGDTIYNDRAVSVPAGTPGTLVKTIGNCGTFAPLGTNNNFTTVPINACTGPATFTTNLRVTKTFGFGRYNRADDPRNTQRNGQGGPPQGGPGGGPGGRGGGGGRGGPGGGFGGGGASSGRRYNVSLGAQAQNIFNIVDRTVPVGTLSSPSFGTSTQLAGNIFTTDSAVRRVSLQLSFSF